MLSEKEKIDLITQISFDINEVNDLDMLLEKILTHVRRFFNADAGSIYLKQGDKLKFSYTQNNTLQQRMGENRKLIYNTFFVPISNHSISGHVAKNCRVINIPDVYNMSGSEPYKFDSDFDRISDYRTISMLTVPMTNQQSKVLGIMQIINAQDENGKIIPFSRSDESLIKHFATSAALAIERAQMTRYVLMRMISMAEMRDPSETGAHVNRVASYSVEIYEQWAWKKALPIKEVEREKDTLRMASMLHDVGKVAISDLILKKPARLTYDEFELMKMHTFLGARLFKDPRSEFEELASLIALTHHEKWEGTGYPGLINPMNGKSIPDLEGSNGKPAPLKGEEIPIFGRIVAVADVYDALSSRRCYKEAWEEDRVQEEMHNGRGTHFDPEVIDAFFSRMDVIKSIAKKYPEETTP